MGQHGIDFIKKFSDSHAELKEQETRLVDSVQSLLDELGNCVSDARDESALDPLIETLSDLAGGLRAITGRHSINRLFGDVLTLLIEAERRIPNSRRIMRSLVKPETANSAVAERKRLLVINSSLLSTKAACFEGIHKSYETELHFTPDTVDNVDEQVEAILQWLSESRLVLSSFDGFACRCGFVRPVPSGIYRLVPEMLHDLEQPRIPHGSNISVPITMKLAELVGDGKELLLTTSDPVVTDEVDTVERLTGFIKIKRDGTGAHYLTHKAVWRMLSSILQSPEETVHAVTAHIGIGMSVALHRNGRIVSLIDAVSGMPTAIRCGPLDIPRLLDGLKTDEITFKELEAVTFSRGGLISLAGTNDFRTLDAFRSKGATETQQKKIDLIFDFLARQITSAVLRLTSDGKPVDVVAMTGGLARSEELVRRIRENIAGRYPLVFVPGSIELESLAAGWLRGKYEPENLKEYIVERDALRHRRQEEDRLLDTVIFERKVTYRKRGAPIVTLDELIDATWITVKENYTPIIGIVGAHNEEAILAAKRANEEGNYRIAKFKLLGDFAEISQIAYDYDLTIDNDNYTILDTENPVEDAVHLLETNQAQILMKGGVKTEQLLHGVFHFLKNSGRLKSGELISHVFVMDIPVRNKLLLISDAAVNPYPDEEKRIKIIENALKVAVNLNTKTPRVAVVSAIETVNLSIESSIEAGHIAEHFAGRTDCIVEGPLSFDVAMDQDIAREKHYAGKIQGNADILILPDIDAGNVLYKSLTTQSGATAAGVILCGDMPLVLTSRGDSARSKLSSLSLAVKLLFDLKSA